jgi:phage shock protein E
MDLSYLWIVLAVAFIGWKLWSMRRSPAQLAAIQEALDGGALLVDVRSPGEFASGHLPGARNIPVARIQGALGELKAAGRPVVVYCASGTRAGVALATLKAAGVGPLFNLGTVGNGRQLRFPEAS